MWAADHERREIWVGVPTVWTIVGNRLAPWVAERYLDATGFSGQQTDEPLDPDRPDYVFDVLDADRDYGSAGPFGDRSHGRSPQLTLALHRRATAAVAGTAVLNVTAAVIRAGRRR